MTKFNATIEEHVVETFEIEASDMDEAMEIAKEKYKNGEIELCPGELHTKLISCYDPNTTDVTDFIEF